MSDYVHPDNPTPGTCKFLKPQTAEMPDPGFYYAGGALNPFMQPMNPFMNPPMNNGVADSRRYLPDPMPQQTPQMPQMPAQNQQMGLNSFVEARRQQTIPQPAVPPVAPYAQMMDTPLAPMNDMFISMDPTMMRPYGTYTDMTNGAIVPSFNKRYMWGENSTPKNIYDAPVIDWASLPQQPVQVYNPTAQPMGYVQQNSSMFYHEEPSVFQNTNYSNSWEDRAKSVWK